MRRENNGGLDPNSDSSICPSILSSLTLLSSRTAISSFPIVSL